MISVRMLDDWEVIELIESNHVRLTKFQVQSIAIMITPSIKIFDHWGKPFQLYFSMWQNNRLRYYVTNPEGIQKYFTKIENLYLTTGV